MCTPVTSCPASTASAAATAESTPPLIAASTRNGAQARLRTIRRRDACQARRARSTTGPMAATHRVDIGRRSRCGRARSAAHPPLPPPARPSPAARGTAGARRRCRPIRSSTRCPGRPAASAARRPRSPGTAGGRCRAAGSGRRRRRTGPGSPASTTSGTCVADPGDQRVAQLGEPSLPLGQRGRRRRATATANPTMPATSSVPDRTPRSWPPPNSIGWSTASRRSSSAPTPVGPPILCPVRVSASAPLAREVDGELADRLDRVGVQRDAAGVRDLGQFADRVDRADLVVGPHHRDQGDVVRVLGDGRGQGVGVHPAEVVDLEPADDRVLGGRPGARRRRARRGARWRWPGCRRRFGSAADAGPGTDRRRRGCPTRCHRR